jgi:hypothetical protein
MYFSGKGAIGYTLGYDDVHLYISSIIWPMRNPKIPTPTNVGVADRQASSDERLLRQIARF